MRSALEMRHRRPLKVDADAGPRLLKCSSVSITHGSHLLLSLPRLHEYLQEQSIVRRVILLRLQFFWLLVIRHFITGPLQYANMRTLNTVSRNLLTLK